MCSSELKLKFITEEKKELYIYILNYLQVKGAIAPGGRMLRWQEYFKAPKKTQKAFNRQPISKIFTSFLLENQFGGFWMLLERFLHVSGGAAASNGLLPIIPLLSHKPLDST